MPRVARGPSLWVRSKANGPIKQPKCLVLSRTRPSWFRCRPSCKQGPTARYRPSRTSTMSTPKTALANAPSSWTSINSASGQECRHQTASMLFSPSMTNRPGSPSRSQATPALQLPESKWTEATIKASAESTVLRPANHCQSSPATLSFSKPTPVSVHSSSSRSMADMSPSKSKTLSRFSRP